MFRVIYGYVGFRLVLSECGQLVVQVNDDGSQVVKLPGVTNVSDLVLEDTCAFWLLNCTNSEESVQLGQVRVLA